MKCFFVRIFISIKTSVYDFFKRCGCAFWCSGIVLFLYALFIRKYDYESLEYDDIATMYMTEEQEKEYSKCSVKRRNIAYKAGLERVF